MINVSHSSDRLIKNPSVASNNLGRGQTDKEFNMVYSTQTFPSITLEEIQNNCIVTKSGCHEWQGKRQKNYGVIFYKSRNLAVHRIVCFLAYGEPAENDYALHSCDNPPCVNPAHLRWGTHQENMADAKTRNRRAVKRGERNGRAKLDEAKIKAIRAIYGTGPTTVEIAELYGVSNQIISRIIKREAWSHVA